MAKEVFIGFIYVLKFRFKKGFLLVFEGSELSRKVREVVLDRFCHSTSLGVCSGCRHMNGHRS